MDYPRNSKPQEPPELDQIKDVARVIFRERPSNWGAPVVLAVESENGVLGMIRTCAVFEITGGL